MMIRQTLPEIENRAARVAQSSRQQEFQSRAWQRRPQRFEGDHHEPTHADINQGRNEAKASGEPKF